MPSLCRLFVFTKRIARNTVAIFCFQPKHMQHLRKKENSPVLKCRSETHKIVANTYKSEWIFFMVLVLVGNFLYLSKKIIKIFFSMKYDPIKKSLGKVFNKNPFLRKIFYKLLDLLLLRAWFVKRELKRWSKDKSDEINILDAGAGFGQYVYFISTLSKKWNIKAVDVKEEQIEDCNNFFSKIKKSDRIKFEFADLTKFNDEKKFDLILSVDVMEHIEDDLSVFRNFHSSLKDDGMLLISTPSDKAEDHHDHDEEEGEGHFFVEEHVREGYNIDDIKVKLKSAGFQKVETYYSYGKPGTLAWKLSMKIPIIVLNFSKLFFILLPFYYLIVYPWAFVLNYFDLKGKHKSGRGLVVKAWKF